jgi:hypothetical protein
MVYNIWDYLEFLALSTVRYSKENKGLDTGR